MPFVVAGPFTIAVLALFVLLGRSLRRGRRIQGSALSLAVGLSLVVVDLRRPTGLLVFLAAPGSSVWPGSSTRAHPAGACRVLPAAVLAGGGELLERAELTVRDEMTARQRAVALVAYTDTSGIGQCFAYRPWAAFDGASEHELVVRRYLSEVLYSCLERSPRRSARRHGCTSLGGGSRARHGGGIDA